MISSQYANQYANHVCFLLESELESEAEEQGRITNAYWCQCGESKHMALWLLIQKACVVRTLMKFLKD